MKFIDLLEDSLSHKSAESETISSVYQYKDMLVIDFNNEHLAKQNAGPMIITNGYDKIRIATSGTSLLIGHYGDLEALNEFLTKYIRRNKLYKKESLRESITNFIHASLPIEDHIIRDAFYWLNNEIKDFSKEEKAALYIIATNGDTSSIPQEIIAKFKEYELLESTANLSLKSMVSEFAKTRLAAWGQELDEIEIIKTKEPELHHPEGRLREQVAPTENKFLTGSIHNGIGTSKLQMAKVEATETYFLIGEFNPQKLQQLELFLKEWNPDGSKYKLSDGRSPLERQLKVTNSAVPDLLEQMQQASKSRDFNYAASSNFLGEITRLTQNSIKQ